MTIHFHILSASGVLTGALRERLEGALRAGGTRCNEMLTLADIDVVVRDAPDAVIPRIGVNGFSFDAYHVALSLDHKHPHLIEHFDSTIQSLLAHELHHCARSLARGTSHGRTYGGSLVAEGLACCFEEEIGERTPFYAIECKGSALRQFADKARNHLHVEHGKLPGYWSDWMFGRAGDDREFPYQCGYSTGYAIVRAWLDATGNTAASAAGIDEVEILADWQTGRITPFP
ncbi:DUF2268 domain-containing protein [Boseaceae bacterium BT-24-1]|nr:DUF2268 domain-containing protein [Boseaceae bacterium BT-24-1]